MKLIHLTTPAPIAARGGKPKKGSFGTPAAACIPGHCPRVEPWVIGVIVGAIVFGILLLAGAYYGYTKGQLSLSSTHDRNVANMKQNEIARDKASPSDRA